MGAGDCGCNGLSVTKPCLQKPGETVDILYVDQAAGGGRRRKRLNLRKLAVDGTSFATYTDEMH